MNTPLDSRQLRAFTSLARNGSFTLTAAELFLTQSAVSHSIRALEEDLGCRLFDRLGKKISLTLAGEHLLQHTEKILREMQEARGSIERLSKWGKSRLRLGASATACQYILPGVLRQLKRDCPQTLLSVFPGDTAEVADGVRKGQIDLALALEPVNDAGLEYESLFTDDLWFITDPQHAWALRGRVERDEIPRQNYILYNRSSATFRLVEDYFRHERVVLNLFIELGSMEAIKELVKLGLGVGILSPWITRQELRDKSLVALPLGRRRLQRHWCVLRRQGRRPTLAEETFIRLCREAGERLVQLEQPPGVSPNN